mmetsp:Transcript_7845/g.7419  ORF Transcript_7845/g.7419 Transcript_7845/m.7419 type:complete len:193 (-) Transcript_7845:103-681(-)|eukprot:CAMPEP_0197837994 /NCGR_PEP_ID=MMETSP1437-20131217/33962_1 /TAXON_ID=49252 ORGANISM="Eucampia antarctica, Strain CCMP1452" /NCGR_SAMPLE_ID=MMETSP1437 /ASSEMBLY_ACC=CAM_ASM_001096 /LENGTH=192 /DNA_ID=CAMNT_0043445489 /DNA_START=92 /DNA_END=670 /DNA_ORIENTATION=-
MGGSAGDGLKNYWGDRNDRPHKIEGPCVSRTINAIMAGAAAGTLFGSAQLAWYPDAITSGTRFGGVIGKTDKRAIIRSLARPALWMSSAAAAFAAVECGSESVREKKDSFNAMLGGMAAGFVIAATTRRVDIMTSAAFGMGLFMFALDMTGESTVFNRDEVKEKMHGVLPTKHQESAALSALKDKYPQHKGL